MFKIIDTKTDDSSPKTGSVQCNQAITLGSAGVSAVLTQNDSQTTYDDAAGCVLSFSTAM